MKLSLFVGCHEWIELEEMSCPENQSICMVQVMRQTLCHKPQHHHFYGCYSMSRPQRVGLWPNGFPRFISCWGAFREPAHGATAQRAKSQGTTLETQSSPGLVFHQASRNLPCATCLYLFHMYYNHVYLERERVWIHMNKSIEFRYNSTLRFCVDIPSCPSFSHRISRILLSDLSPPFSKVPNFLEPFSLLVGRIPCCFTTALGKNVWSANRQLYTAC